MAWRLAGHHPRPRRLEPAEKLVSIPVGKADVVDAQADARFGVRFFLMWFSLYVDLANAGVQHRSQCSEYRPLTLVISPLRWSRTLVTNTGHQRLALVTRYFPKTEEKFGRRVFGICKAVKVGVKLGLSANGWCRVVAQHSDRTPS